MIYRPELNEDEGDIFTGSRVCRLCGKRKKMPEFHWANGKKHRRRTCKACDYSRSEKMKDRKPEKYARAARNRSFKRKYGITVDEFDAMLIEQGFRCRICRQLLEAKNTHIDHDHRTGKVRGLLCTNCNLGLGHFRDDISRLIRAAAYLQTTIERDIITT